MNDTISSDQLIYKHETSDSSAIKIDLFGATAVSECFDSDIEVYIVPKPTYPVNKHVFRVIDGHLFSVDAGFPE